MLHRKHSHALSIDIQTLTVTGTERICLHSHTHTHTHLRVPAPIPVPVAKSILNSNTSSTHSPTYHVRHIFHVVGSIEVFHALAAVRAVLGKVKVAPGCNAHQLLGSEGELEGDVCASSGIVSELAPLMHTLEHVLSIESNTHQPVPGLVDPLLVELTVGGRRAGETRRRGHFNMPSLLDRMVDK